MSRSMFVFMLIIVPFLALGLACLGLATLPTNAMGWFLLVMGLCYVVGGPLYLRKRRNEPPAQKEERNDRSFWLIQPGFIITIFGAPLDYLYLQTLPHLAWLPWLGLALVALSIVLLVWARQAIRGQFSGHLQIQPEHRLVQDGPYHFVRHPGYLGYMLLALGIAIGYASLIAACAAFFLLLPGLIYRIQVEENLLVEAFGDEYRGYMRRTKRLVPGVW